ncbi:unnamed protein product, partial [Oppiella nova]
MTTHLDKPIKLVMIVRDPRGIMSSRYLPAMDWCRDDTTCAEIDMLCDHHITLVRYEDLSLNAIETAKRLYNKLDLHFNADIESWIESHTNDTTKLGNPYSTVRKSKSAVFSWVKRLNATQIDTIQEKCTGVMDYLGYNIIDIKNLQEFR